MDRFPDKPPTPAEYAVIAVAASVALIGCGVVALTIAARTRADHPAAAAALEARGWWLLGIGLFIALAFWIVRRLTG